MPNIKMDEFQKQFTKEHLEEMTAKDSRAAMEAVQKLPKELRQKLLKEVNLKTFSRLSGEEMAQNLRNLPAKD